MRIAISKYLIDASLLISHSLLEALAMYRMTELHVTQISIYFPIGPRSDSLLVVHHLKYRIHLQLQNPLRFPNLERIFVVR